MARQFILITWSSLRILEIIVFLATFDFTNYLRVVA